ncbi:metal-dependent hydrolase [Candidatus Woesearchaeota archaeon]|jgi:membrane-bound metal-dependent hydrolase YbcI (DUF457 family)|nr:metal-dependent hydrolase [Candidatus Woesearchaeota archaeon]
MPLAVTHILSSIILTDLYRDYITNHKKFFTLHTIFIAGIGGLLPDIDIPIKLIFNLFNWTIPQFLQHGGITHTPFFAILFLIPGLILWVEKKQKFAAYSFVLAFGIFLHIFLDFLIGGGAAEGIMWLYPISTQAWSIHLISYFNLADIPAALDAIILLAWLYHEEIKHKITDFI